jgi:hypothetical protein
VGSIAVWLVCGSAVSTALPRSDAFVVELAPHGSRSKGEILADDAIIGAIKGVAVRRKVAIILSPDDETRWSRVVDMLNKISSVIGAGTAVGLNIEGGRAVGSSIKGGCQETKTPPVPQNGE